MIPQHDGKKVVQAQGCRDNSGIWWLRDELNFLFNDRLSRSGVETKLIAKGNRLCGLSIQAENQCLGEAYEVSRFWPQIPYKPDKDSVPDSPKSPIHGQGFGLFEGSNPLFFGWTFIGASRALPKLIRHGWIATHIQIGRHANTATCIQIGRCFVALMHLVNTDNRGASNYIVQPLWLPSCISSVFKVKFST
jgi:hypothetical protein